MHLCDPSYTRLDKTAVNSISIIPDHFSVFAWTGKNESNTLRVDAYIFKKGA